MSHTFYSHPDSASTILPILASHVPQSITLYRRIQYHLHYPSPTAHVLASFPPSTTPADDKPWLVTHIDLSRGLETNAWLFSSLELSPKSASAFPPTITTTGSKSSTTTSSSSASTPSNDDDSSDPEALATRDQFLALLSHIRTMLFPPHDPTPSILYGALHTRLRNMIPSPAIIRDSDIYAKHIFPPSSYAAPEAGQPDIPQGYRFAKDGMPQKDLPLVLRRTEIPRTVATLASLPSVGVYTTDAADAREKSTEGAMEEGGDESREPISWAFLGLDASLTSLHVEPEHRGKRVGVDVARKIFRDGLAGKIFGNELTRLGERDVAHSDVALYNQGSRRVMERLGGVPRWTVLWTAVDLEKLRRVMEAEQ